MLKIHPIPAFTDNYIWAIINDETQEVIIVDAGDAEPVLEFVNRENLTITGCNHCTYKWIDGFFIG